VFVRQTLMRFLIRHFFKEFYGSRVMGYLQTTGLVRNNNKGINTGSNKMENSPGLWKRPGELFHFLSRDLECLLSCFTNFLGGEGLGQVSDSS
jgi:hypothetical protein